MGETSGTMGTTNVKGKIYLHFLRFVTIPIFLACTGGLDNFFPQDLQHAVSVVNIEIPVRVFSGSQFVSDLRAVDFEVLDNGIAQEIIAVYLIQGSTIKREEGPREMKPQIARQIVLLFDMMDWQPEIDRALDFFFDDVIQPADSLMIITPRRKLRLASDALALKPAETIKDELRGILRQDFLMGSSEYRGIIDELYRALSRPPEGGYEVPLNERMEIYEQCLSRLENLRTVDEKGLIEFAGILKALPGQKFIYLFYQKEMVPQFNPKVEIKTFLDQTHDLALTFKMMERLQLFTRDTRFDVTAVKRAYADASVSVHFLFLTKTSSERNPISVYQNASAPSEITMVERSEDIYNAFGEVARATGGLTDTSANLEASFVRAVNAAENYYLIYYQPKNYIPDGSFHELSVRVKKGRYAVSHRAGYTAK